MAADQTTLVDDDWPTVQFGQIGPEERRTAILRIVQAQGFATLEELAGRFSLSVQTVRRDVIQLDSDGLVQRFHGGAGMRNTVRLGYVEKKGVSSDAKHRIAVKMASMVPDGSVVFVDVGTTCEAVARALGDKGRLRIFTTSLAVGAMLGTNPNLEVNVLGGRVAGPDGSLVGPGALDQIAHLRFDYAVIGISGFDEDGWVMDFDLDKVAIKRGALRQAGQAYAVADSSKFHRQATVRAAPLGAFSAVITEASPPEALASLAEQSGTRFVVTEG